MKTFILLLGFSVLNFSAFSQENQKQKIDNSIREWTPLLTESSLSIDYKFIDCVAEIGYDQELVLYRIKNETDQKIDIEWFMHLYYNGVCKTCAYPDEYIYKLTLEPNEILEGECSMYGDYRLKVFSKFLDDRYTGGSQLTKFEIKDLYISIQK